MDLQRIVKKRLRDSSGKRVVYVWERSGLEIKPGLYVAEVKRNTYLSRVFQKEVFIAQLQGEQEMHEMYVANKINLANLPESIDISKHLFSFIRQYTILEASEILCSRFDLGEV